MQVVITKDQLEKSSACLVYLDSPEWDTSRQALVYSDWEKTVERLMSTRAGTTYLDFLVVRKLVPMTTAELAQKRQVARLAEIQRAQSGGS